MSATGRCNFENYVRGDDSCKSCNFPEKHDEPWPLCYNRGMEENLDTPVDSLFADILGPEYWVSNSGVSRRSWEILLLRKAMLDDHLWSLAECAARYGISRERVRQLEEDAIAKLVVWKKAEDEKRMARRRRLLGIERRTAGGDAEICADSAAPMAQAEMLCLSRADIPSPDADAPRPVRRHRTFASLRAQLLTMLP